MKKLLFGSNAILIKVTIGLILYLSIISCEGPIGVNGYVWSEQTHEPLGNVKIILYKEEEVIDTIYSNGKGRFEGMRYTSCLKGCPNSSMKFIKSNYDTLTVFFDIQGRADPNVDLNNYPVYLTAE